MRPAVHASILRNRTQRARRLNNRPHTFSLSRLLMLVLVGAIMFVPGLALTILGVEKHSSLDSLPRGERIMYKAVGPAMCVLGVGTLFGACVYYCCYAGDRARRPVSQQGSVMSTDSRNHPGAHASIRSHHHHHENGHSLGTPDGMKRRGSYNDDNAHHHHHHHHHHHVAFDEEAVPLAQSEKFSTIDSLSPTHPTVSITIEEASDDPDPRQSPTNEVTERMINGDIRTSSYTE